MTILNCAKFTRLLLEQSLINNLLPGGIMNLKEYRKQITALQKESGEYAVNKAPLGKEVQAQAIARQA